MLIIAAMGRAKTTVDRPTELFCGACLVVYEGEDCSDLQITSESMGHSKYSFDSWTNCAIITEHVKLILGTRAFSCAVMLQISYTFQEGVYLVLCQFCRTVAHFCLTLPQVSMTSF